MFENSFPKMIVAEKSTRFINFLIDSGIFLFIIFLHAMVLDSWLGLVPEGGFELFPLYLLALYPTYYFLFEYVFQKTPGKFLTRTKVVDLNGNKVTTKSLFIRSLSRLIPLEAFSFLFCNKGWHDVISNTCVVES